ncbi:hypothetical protein VST7929_01258 [Vibrio stylophorae]|uniref:ABC3 transporter permease C-terminal domain-containing protein n=1 Tax=Vibrio stylophorae TaxID=659351 RepID=A0ABN8DTP0_9VIBR|nr:ABC transporter permease [Vibrio stylophorae]CAH0533392.1 hypothetical protein VST7929_01258 [Vibrio stylophorae]
MFSPVVKALFAHYRKHPLQILFVWLGLTLGIALFVGVLSINEHARQSYREGERMFASPYPLRIMHSQKGLSVPEAFYINLRRHGFTECTPIDVIRVETSSYRDMNLFGVDPVAMLSHGMLEQQQELMLALMKAPYPILVGRSTADYMGFFNGQRLHLSDGKEIGPIKVVSDELVGGPRMLADLAMIRQLRPSAGFDYIACSAMSHEEEARLVKLLPSLLVLDREDTTELEPLTEAFHLNLYAMGLLAFVVGLFIFYQAINLSLTQRQLMAGQLRQLGVSVSQLCYSLVLELLSWVFLGWLGGNLAGMALARRLLPSMAETLSEFYGTNISLSLSWQWQWGAYSFALAVFGVLLASFFPIMRLLRTPARYLSSRLTLARFTNREYAWQAVCGVLLLNLGFVFYHSPQSQPMGFMIIALILIGAGLLMPWFVWWLFHFISNRSRRVKVRWFFNDAAVSLSYRGVAAMAFMLALASNIGMATTVGSFRATTESWLEQRLAADVYIQPPARLERRIADWLNRQDEVQSIWWQLRKELRSSKGIMQVMSTGDSEGEKNAMAIKTAEPDYWQRLHHENSVLVSESLALRMGWELGTDIVLPNLPERHWTVVGIYYDYGNPHGQLTMSHHNWLALWPIGGEVALAVHLKPGKSSKPLISRLSNIFRLQPERVQNNSRIQQQAMGVFDRTFMVTDALGKLTLVIAVFGLFFATTAAEISRQRHVALMRCMGVSAREILCLGVGQLMVIGLISALIALPLGILLSKLLIEVVLKYAFGWTMPMALFPMDYLHIIFSALFALMVAGIWPVWRLTQRSAVTGLRESL